MVENRGAYEVKLSHQISLMLFTFQQCKLDIQNLKRVLEKLILDKREMLFLNKKAKDMEPSEARLHVVRNKKGHEHPFKLFHLMFPQTDVRGGQRNPRDSRPEPRGGLVVKNKGWMLEKVHKALKDWQQGVGGNSRKMLMEKLAATQRMMPIPRIG